MNCPYNMIVYERNSLFSSAQVLLDTIKQSVLGRFGLMVYNKNEKWEAIE